MNMVVIKLLVYMIFNYLFSFNFFMTKKYHFYKSILKQTVILRINEQFCLYKLVQTDNLRMLLTWPTC